MLWNSNIPTQITTIKKSIVTNVRVQYKTKSESMNNYSNKCKETQIKTENEGTHIFKLLNLLHKELPLISM